MRSRRSILLVALLCSALVLLAAPSAHATTGGYAKHSWAGCGGGFNSGTWDDSGRVYVPCGNPTSIGVYDESATLVQSIHLDYFVSDVAPTRDGAYLYLATGGASKRLARQVDGSYAADPSWAPQDYVMWGSTTFSPKGQFVATDRAGRVYLSDGYWSSNNTHTVLVYEPDGTLVTRFGEWVEESWALGSFYWALGGVAVSDDGSTVYTTEAGNNRIQTWTWDGNSYEATASFGGTAAKDPNRVGACDYAGWQTWFAAPYDIALDGAGNVYVVNTTCKQVLRFAPGPGALQANLDVRLGTGTHPRPHGFAVGRDGTVYVGENQYALRPAGGAIPAGGAPPVRPAAPTPVPDPEPEPTPDPVVPTDPAPTPDPAPPTNPAPTTDPTNDTIGVPADEVAPRVMLGATRVVWARRVSVVRLAARCNERCLVDVKVFERRRLVSRRAAWLPRARSGNFRVAVRRAARRRSVIVLVTVRDSSRNRVHKVRVVRV